VAWQGNKRNPFENANSTLEVWYSRGNPLKLANLKKVLREGLGEVVVHSPDKSSDHISGDRWSLGAGYHSGLIVSTSMCCTHRKGLIAASSGALELRLVGHSVGF